MKNLLTPEREKELREKFTTGTDEEREAILKALSENSAKWQLYTELLDKKLQEIAKNNPQKSPTEALKDEMKEAWKKIATPLEEIKEEGTEDGSLYTHDTHLETSMGEVLTKLTGMDAMLGEMTATMTGKPQGEINPVPPGRMDINKQIMLDKMDANKAKAGASPEMDEVPDKLDEQTQFLRSIEAILEQTRQAIAQSGNVGEKKPQKPGEANVNEWMLPPSILNLAKYASTWSKSNAIQEVT